MRASQQPSADLYFLFIMSTKKTFRTLAAFMSGAAAGAAFGILFAPGRGSETRDRLSFQLEKYREKLRELSEDLVASKDNATSSAKTEGERVIRDAKTKAEALLGDVDDIISQINERKDG